MAEIERYLFQTRCDFIFLEMFCLDPYVLVDRPFQPQRPFYYIADITVGREDIPLSCVNEIDSTPPPKVEYSKNTGQNIAIFFCFIIPFFLMQLLCYKKDKILYILLLKKFIYIFRTKLKQ